MSANAKEIEQARPKIRIVPAESKKPESVTVELQKIRRELLTLANRVEKLSQGKD